MTNRPKKLIIAKHNNLLKVVLNLAQMKELCKDIGQNIVAFQKVQLLMV